jgi:hypothetical protein
VLTSAAVLEAPGDPSGRGLLVVVAAVLVLALAAAHVRLLLRAAPRRSSSVTELHDLWTPPGADRADW